MTAEDSVIGDINDMKPSTMRILLIAFLALLAIPSGRCGDFFFALPAGTQTIEGNTNSYAPFSTFNFQATSMRYQQVFPGGTFGVFSQDQPVLIDQIYFRLDQDAFASLNTRFDLEVHLSTTSHAVDDLSLLFAENVGPDDTTVMPRGSWGASVLFDPTRHPQLFFWFNLAQPFYFQPTTGNLLMDIRHYGLHATPPFDAGYGVNDLTSRLWSTDAAAVSGTADSVGLVAGFHGTIVPEPSSFLLLGVGSVVLAFAIRWRQLRRN